MRTAGEEEEADPYGELPSDFHEDITMDQAVATAIGEYDRYGMPPSDIDTDITLHQAEATALGEYDAYGMPPSDIDEDVTVDQAAATAVGEYDAYGMPPSDIDEDVTGDHAEATAVGEYDAYGQPPSDIDDEPMSDEAGDAATGEGDVYAEPPSDIGVTWGDEGDVDSILPHSGVVDRSSRTTISTASKRMFDPQIPYADTFHILADDAHRFFDVCPRRTIIRTPRLELDFRVGGLTIEECGNSMYDHEPYSEQHHLIQALPALRTGDFDKYGSLSSRWDPQKKLQKWIAEIQSQIGVDCLTSRDCPSLNCYGNLK